MDFLGNTRELIGAEKAGIFRKGISAICGELNPPQSLVDSAQKVGASLKLIDRDFRFELQENHWCFRSEDYLLDSIPMPALIGDFQLYNASCVIAAIVDLQDILPLSEEAIEKGLLSVRLHGRYQYLSSKPDVILDVAHNPHAAKSLASNLKNTSTSGKTFAVFAMLADKDIAGVVNAIAAEVDEWYVSGIYHTRGAEGVQIKEMILSELPGASISLFHDVANAYAEACIDANENDRIIILGSFFTVAEVMRALQTATIKNGINKNGAR
jgi:dihydrofolate synthase/folylpolyglutamate synthase